MTERSRVLIALDFDARGEELSPGSAQTLAAARDHVSRTGALARVCHIEVPDPEWEYHDGEWSPEDAPLSPAGRERLEAAAASLGEGATSVVREGEPWREIAQEVRDWGADLLFTAKRANPERDARRLGVVSTKLLRKCSARVWAVQPDAAVPPRTILVAVDGSPMAQRVLDAATEIARASEAELHVIRVFGIPMSRQMEGDRESFVNERRQELEAELRDRLAKYELDTPVHVHVGFGVPARRILQGVERLRPDLVVLGTVSRGGVAGLLVGNTAERLLGEIDASLLAVKPTDFRSPLDDPEHDRG